mmetsp:Transcript_48489/g.80512  ORF Transcript_48489/g.80512 Transcript_48489/m.80512 type:complete len:215 (-) Transcript_48489:85-729(-)
MKFAPPNWLSSKRPRAKSVSSTETLVNLVRLKEPSVKKESVMLAPWKLAPSKLAPLPRSTNVIFTHRREAKRIITSSITDRERSASSSRAASKDAPDKSAPLRLTNRMSALSNTEPCRSAKSRLAPIRGAPRKSCPRRCGHLDRSPPGLICSMHGFDSQAGGEAGGKGDDGGSGGGDNGGIGGDGGGGNKGGGGGDGGGGGIDGAGDGGDSGGK